MRQLALAVLFLTSCASMRTMVASPGDLDDYRSFRVAAAEGTRVARAKRYLERHPRGAFAEEVRAAYELEEQRYFEKAQESREGALRYLADLPDGPHAEAALALVTALASNMADAELTDVARRARFEEARLEDAAVQRRAVGEAILSAVGVLLDDGVYGVPLEDVPLPLRRILLGRGGPTWGSIAPRREEDFFFLLPTRPERESRLLTLVFALETKDAVVTAGTIEGSDMFVRWAEADMITKLDPGSPDDRTEAQVHAEGRLGGALERRFPAATCEDRRKGKELHHRVCDGWEVVVTAGTNAGDLDRIVVRGRGKRSADR